MSAIIAILGVALVAIFLARRNAEKEAVKLKLVETKAKDQALAEHQTEVRKAIDALDKGIEAAKKEQEILEKKRKEDSLSLKDRARRIKRGIE